jgi:hypothetical protein
MQNQRARNRDTLALAAGELVRVTVLVLRIQPAWCMDRLMVLESPLA